MSVEIFEKIDDILNASDVPERHTFFQLKNFIIGKECTVQGQLWQVVRELRARKDGLESLYEQIADLDDNLILIEIRLQRLGRPEDKNQLGVDLSSDQLYCQEWDVNIRKAEREKRTLTRTRDRLENQAKYLLEEITYLTSAFAGLSKIEPMKPLDDVESQQKYWNEKFLEELNLRLILKQPIDSDFVRTVMALDDSSSVKVQMVSILQGVQNQIIADRERQMAAQAKIEEAQKRIGKTNV